MKKPSYIIGVLALVIACNRQESPQVITNNSAKDSLMKQLQHKDSSLMAYVKSMNDIQHGIDTVMMEAKMLRIYSETKRDTASLTTQLKMIGAQMIKNQKAIAYLQHQLKTSNDKNNDLADLGEHLSVELNEKDSEIASIQHELIQTKSSLRTLVNQFNDSLNVINQERAQVNLMTTEKNKVYYIFGTEKELADKGIITTKGGVVGLGRVPLFSQNANTSGFTGADLNDLHEIELNGRFTQMVTTHPDKSYRVTHTSPDKLIITDPEDFWSKSKYMIAIVQ
jgi:hypothetical protein